MFDRVLITPLHTLKYWKGQSNWYSTVRWLANIWKFFRRLIFLKFVFENTYSYISSKSRFWNSEIILQKSHLNPTIKILSCFSQIWNHFWIRLKPIDKNSPLYNDGKLHQDLVLKRCILKNITEWDLPVIYFRITALSHLKGKISENHKKT